MSKEKPEVGDVFESIFAKYYIVKNTKVCSTCLVIENESILIRDVVHSYFEFHCEYLGKSKVSIKELFDVENAK